MKVLIIEPTKVHYGDDRGAVHTDAGLQVDVPKDTAKVLTENRRALYVSASDDPFKDRRFTASKEELRAAEALAKTKAAEALAKPANPAEAGGGA